MSGIVIRCLDSREVGVWILNLVLHALILPLRVGLHLVLHIDSTDWLGIGQ